ncbi:MAG TPA: cohesin domain-containing protein [Longimicrobiaceae bacterium]|nr:cohesin domain-containing protein [Longimicrobiaceae bacterium]
MSRTRWKAGSRVLALALGVGLTMACKDAAQPMEPDVLEGLGPGIHPVVVVAGKSGSTTQVELHLRRVQVEDRVASYQGELEYDTGKLSLVGAELPGGIAGAWNETAPGKIRFAGATLEGIADAAVLVMRFEAKGDVKAGAFKVRMEEVVASVEFRNLTPQVVSSEQPLFSSRPLP